MKVEEMPRASEGDTIELEGKVIKLKAPNSNDFDGEIVWGQFVVLKDDTGEQGCWLKLDSQEDKVTKGTQITINGKLGKEYTDSRGKLKRSINNCDFEVIGKVQGPAQSSGSSAKRNGNGTKDNYWEKKFAYEVQKDPIVQTIIVRQCAIKAATELAKIPPSKTFLIKVHTEKDFFEFADKIFNHIFKNIDLIESLAILGGEIIGTSENGTPKVETKEERVEKAEGIVGETRFRPASTLQKNKIFGYRDKEGWHKGMIESRYIEKEEIREIGSPEKLSVEKASDWLAWWWGVGKEEGERKKREREHPRNEDGTLVGALVKGDKTSLAKDVLIDDINALRRENFLIDDVKFEKELGYTSHLENLTEEELSKLKEVLKHYNPL